jgi:hypothetical protein
MMRIFTVVILGLAVVPLTAARAFAQEEKQPASKELPPATAEPAHSDTVCPPWPGFRVLWVEREVPIQTLVPREVTTFIPITTFEVAYRPEKRVVTELTMKPREVERPVTSCTVKPVTVTCPTTGTCSTVMQPCTEVKMVKQTEYVAVAEQREITVQIPFLRTVETKVPRTDVILEYRTELRKVPGLVKVPAGDEAPQRRVFVSPKPPCPEPVAQPRPESPPMPESP